MKYTFAFTFLGALALSCTRTKINPDGEDCEQEITYNNEIETIINSSCAYSGCHKDGVAPGDLTSYDGLLNYTSSDLFRQRVVVLKNMPPSYAPSKIELTKEELDLVNCWISGGYKE